MISYTRTPADAPPGRFAVGFVGADTDEVGRIGRGICRFVWSACVWTGGVRAERNFLFSDWCALDFEDETYPLSQAVNDFCDCVHVIGTTRNHRKSKDGQPPLDRFRVMIPWERRITDLREFRHNMQRMVDVYPIDRKCTDGARFFFPCTEIVSAAGEGFRQKVFPAPASKPPKPYPKGVIAPWTRRALERAIPPGGRNSTFYGVAKDLLKAGFAPDHVRAMIDGSATQQNKATAISGNEIAQLVQSAVKSMEAGGWKTVVAKKP